MDVALYDLNLLFLQKTREWLVSGQEHKARLLLGVTPDAATLLKNYRGRTSAIWRRRTSSASPCGSHRISGGISLGKTPRRSGPKSFVGIASRALRRLTIMTPYLLRNRKRELALQLLERQLRTTPVTLLTGLPESEVRKLYRMLHDRSP